MAWRAIHPSVSLVARNINNHLPRLCSSVAPPRFFHSSVPLFAFSAANTHVVSAYFSRFPIGVSLGSKSFSTGNEGKINTKVNFSLPDSDDDEDIEIKGKEIDKSKLPPPYDPFNKKSPLDEQDPKDPKDLQEVFHKMRTEGLTNNAVKMFDGLSKDGLTHEALELFSQIKDKGSMPDVVAHTAVIEAYANAGQAKEAVKVFLRMLACGVAPNAYTYTVLIKGICGDAKFVGDAKKYLVEMVRKGMRPNAGTYYAVFEALVKEHKEEEAREFLQQLKGNGFMADEKAVREISKTKRGQVFRTVINILFDK